MKIKIGNTFALVTLFSLLSFTATAQWDGNKVFSAVDNTKNFTTLELASMDKNLSTFVHLVNLSGLAPSMLLSDAHTLFIPTNDSFRDMTIERFAELTNPKNKVELMKFVQYHILPNEHMKGDFKESQVITDAENKEISVSTDVYGNVFISGAKIIKPDIEASNGVIHVVNDYIDANLSL